MSEEKKGPGFLNGLIWGAAIGAGIVLLVKTKTGKKILKTLSENIKEEGLREVGKLNDMLEEQEDYEAMREEEEMEEMSQNHSNGNGSTINKLKSTTKRFFRGVPKKS